MGTVLHKDLLATENHKIQYWTWASDAARLAQSVAPSDIGKVGYQTDTKAFYILTDWSPASWSPLSTYASVGVVRAIYYASANQALTIDKQVNYDAKVVDTDNAVTVGTSWKFTCPAGKGGSYQVSGTVVFNGAQTVYMWKNGVAYRAVTTSSVSGYVQSFSTLVDLNPGDYIDLRATGTITLNGGGNQISNIEIYRVPDSGYVAAQTVPVVTVMAARAAAQTVSTTDALIQFDAEYVDSNNAFTTGAGARFTAPVAGIYSIKAILNLAAAGSGMSISIYKNGALQIADGGSAWMASVTTDAFLAVGDYVEIKARSWAGTSPNLTCNLQITRYADQAVSPTIAGFSPVRAEAVQTSAQSVGTGGIVNFDSKSFDSDAALTTGAAWKFTCPPGKGGIYQVLAAVTTNSSGAASALQLFKNGVLAKVLGTAQYNTAVVSALISLSPGDYIDIRCQTAITTYAAVAGFNWVQISSASTYTVQEVSKPTAKVRTSTAWTAATSVFTRIPFDSKLWDSHGAFTLGANSKFTAPLSGKYRVSATTSSASALQGGLYVFKNGANDTMLNYVALASSYLHGSTIIDMAAGDFLELYVFVSGGTRTCDANPVQNWATFEYLGP